jgi:hypothetical protein
MSICDDVLRRQTSERGPAVLPDAVPGLGDRAQLVRAVAAREEGLAHDHLLAEDDFSLWRKPHACAPALRAGERGGGVGAPGRTEGRPKGQQWGV